MKGKRIEREREIESNLKEVEVSRPQQAMQNAKCNVDAMHDAARISHPEHFPPSLSTFRFLVVKYP